MGKRYNISIIHGRRTYSTKELSKLLCVCRETIRNWSKKGLSAINPGEIPLLFLGSDIQTFLKAEKRKRKTTLNENEIYCVRCKTGVTPSPETIQVVYTNKRIGKNDRQVIIKAKCPKCGITVNLFSSQSKQTKSDFLEKSMKATKSLEGDQLNIFNLESK